MTHQLPEVGISSCLLGAKVRFDGNHKRHEECQTRLANHVSFVCFCPEIQIGLPVPRKPIRIVRNGDQSELVGSAPPHTRHTGEMIECADRFLESHPELCGFIGTHGSPSCASGSSKHYATDQRPLPRGDGLFVSRLRELNPILPIEDSGRLNNPALRENFLTRVFTYQRWLDLNRQSLTPRGLVHFHSQHKYLLMSHSYEEYKNLGKLIANLSARDIVESSQEYIHRLMKALSHIPSRGQLVNVLQHLMGYLKKCISPADKQELLHSFTEFREGIVPVIVPLTLLKHHLKTYSNPYLDQQHFFSPYPAQLGLRSYINKDIS